MIFRIFDSSFAAPLRHNAKNRKTDLMMKHFNLILTTLFLLFLVSVAYAAPAGSGQEQMTYKTQLHVIHQHFGVNFVYDSTLDLDIPYKGRPMSEVIRRDGADNDEETLLKCLDTLFQDSDITYEVKRKYVVLTRKSSRKAPKDYTILVEEQRDTLQESVVTAMTDPRRNSTQTGYMRIDTRKLNRGFALFSTPDVIKTLQTLPGVSSGTELLSGFYVHGGDGTDNLYLLDGVPIYQVSHMLGLFSSFNTDVISSLDFYKSGFPARYGSKLSSVVDVNTKDGDFHNYHGTFALGLIDGRLQFEGPLWKGKTSFNFGLRRTWSETLSIPVFAIVNRMNKPDKLNGRYAFTDLNAKITHKFSETNTLSASFYTGRDALKFRSRSFYRSDNDREEAMDLSLAWGNMTGALNWNYELSDKVSMRNIAYYSGSLSDLYIRMSQSEGKDFTTVSGEYSTSNVHNVGLKSDLFHLVGDRQRIRYGATVQLHMYRPSATGKTDVEDGGVKQTYIAYADSLRYNTVEAAVYAEDEIAVTDVFTVNAGLRYALYTGGKKVWHSIEPRLAMKYAFNDRVSVKASYTEMSQASHLISSMYLDLPTNAWLPSTDFVRPSRSREVAGGVYSNFSHYLHLNVEGWYKHMYNLLEYAGVYSVFPPLEGWESNYSVGQGRSWGTEIDFGFDNGRTEANVYYTLSWSQRRFDDFYHSWYRDRNDNRHKLTVMAKHKFGKRFELYGAWNYHSGNRMTVATHNVSDDWFNYDAYTEPNNVKLPDYHRLDLGFNFVKTTKRGNTAIWNLSIYNAYCRVNPISATVGLKQFNGKKFAYYGESIGIIPIVPTFSYTLKF